MTAPEVTVLMPVYNGSAYLAAAIRSILDQRFEDFEFLIIDDGSTEAVGDIVRSFHDERITFIRQENQGLTRTLNRGLRIARGRLIARMDADDLCAPARLDEQVAAFCDNQRLDLVGSFFTVVDDSDCIVESKGLIVDDVYRLWRLAFHNTYAHGSMMYRREAVIRAGMYDERLRYAQDYDLWWRMSRPENSRMIPAALYSHRIRSDGAQSSIRAYDEQLAATSAIGARNLADCNAALGEGDLAAVRALYWRFEVPRFRPASTSAVLATVRGFCRRFGVDGGEQRRLERIVRSDIVTVHRDSNKRLISRWGRLGGGDESPPPSSPGAEPPQAR